MRVAPAHAVPPVPALQVIAVTAVSMTVGALPHVAAGRPAGLTGMATRLGAGARVALSFRPIAGAEGIRRPNHWGVGLALLAALRAPARLARAAIRAPDTARRPPPQ